MTRRSAGPILALIGLIACGGDEPTDDPSFDQPSSFELFSPTTTRLEIEIDYAEGAEPFTGSQPVTGDPFDITEDNLDALFDGTKELILPHSLDDMQGLGPLDGDTFSSDRLLDLAELHRDKLSEGDTATFYVIFVDGYYEKGGEPQQQVLGVNIGDTGVIGMFKPVIASAGDPTGVVDRYVEQATLVHELGHAAGLVATGLPLTADHHDEENGAHCTNTDCIMYFAVEGLSGMLDFIQDYIQSGDTLLFGPDCLADAHAALP